MNDCFLHIHSYAKQHLVEQIMALIGRSSSDPASYRRTLELFEIETLRRTLTEIGMQGSTNPGSPLPDFLFDFPAPSLTENAGVIASADIGTVPGSARECLTLQSTLP